MVQRKGKRNPASADFNGAAGVNPRMDNQEHDLIADTVTLQWGRGCEPADGIPHKNLSSWRGLLQWGRGCEPADGAHDGYI